MEDQGGKDRERDDPEDPPPSPLAREDFRPTIDFDFPALEAEERRRQAEKDRSIPLVYSTPAEEDQQKRDALQQKVAKIEQKILSGDLDGLNWIRFLPLGLLNISVFSPLFLSRFGFTGYDVRLFVDLAIIVIVIGLFITGWVINYRSYKK